MNHAAVTTFAHRAVHRRTPVRFVSLFAFGLCLVSGGATCAADTLATGDWREQWAYSTGLQAVIYGYPVVRNTMARYGMVEKPAGQVDSPLHTFYHQRTPGSADDKYGSSITENLLYSVAWFDVAQEPIVLTVPDAGSRYYGVQMMEMYSDIFAYVGLRATGNKAGSYLVVSPDWLGSIPPGIAGVLRSSTPRGLLLLRIVYDGRDDLAPTHALQDATHIAPLSNWLSGAPYVATTRDVLDPVPPKADPLWFFRTLNRGMTENPPPARDASTVAMLRTVGLGPNQPDDLSTLDAGTRAGLLRAQTDGLAMLQALALSGAGAKTVNQWVYGDAHWGRMALFGDFLGRASPQSFAGMQEHHVEEVVKLRAHHDENGDTLNGHQGQYVLHFAAGQLPEAKSFWSVTLYDEHYDLAANPIGRYSRGSPDRDMRFNSDGSLDIVVQHARPADDHLGNWLPAPDGPFNLFLRAYLPGKALIEQQYVPPPVRRVK